MQNFAVIGVGGYVAPRNLAAIRDTGNSIVAACDPNDSVGILDRFSFDVKFFRETERFDRFLEKLKRGPQEGRVHYVSVCSPNYLHDAHVRLALRVGANAICEKPIVIKPWNLDALQQLEQETGKRVFTIMQLRVHPALVALKSELNSSRRNTKPDVCLTYITARGGWYHVSWKGSEERSGGLVANIGIHFFDLLMWLFGGLERCEVHVRTAERAAGFLELKNANVRWFLSVDSHDLPFAAEPGQRTTYRSITVDGQELEFSDGFTDLHTRVYEKTLAGEGMGIDEARPSISLVHTIRESPLESSDALHPMLQRGPRQLSVSIQSMQKMIRQ